MRVHFDVPEFDAQLLRALTYTYYQGADIGECLATAQYITSKDFDSWHEEWCKTANRIFHEAEESSTVGCMVSARQGFLRASNYYRTAAFFLYSTPQDPRLVETYTKHCVAFDKALALFSTPIENVQIPFENTFLPATFFKIDSSAAPRPVLIINNGYDSTRQECYFIAGAAALARGYHVLCFDGPGQGELLIKQHLPMRHDWESVITPVIDYLVQRHDVDHSRLVLYGPSWGGYLAPRAAAFEHRLAALVANPGQIDVMEAIKLAMPDVIELLNDDPHNQLEKYFGQALANVMFATKMRAKMWIHGTETLSELFRQWKQYNLKGLTQQIACPTLILDSENESMSSGQAKQLFDALICPKKYKLFTAKEGAGEHCEAGASSLSHQYMFDWLQQTLLI